MDRRTAITAVGAVALAVLFVLVLGVLRGAADGAVPRGMPSSSAETPELSCSGWN